MGIATPLQTSAKSVVKRVLAGVVVVLESVLLVSVLRSGLQEVSMVKLTSRHRVKIFFILALVRD